MDYEIKAGEHSFRIEDVYKNQLDLEGFSQMMKDPSYCYKFYWLEALVKLISEGKTETTFGEIIDEMISNAWYSVIEFHIHLSGIYSDGQVRDGLERAVLLLKKKTGLPGNASKAEIKAALTEYSEELKDARTQLTHMVPYRALAGFFGSDVRTEDWNSIRRMTAYIKAFSSEKKLLPYVLGESSRLKKEVFFDPVWMKMIQDNTVSILGWIQYEKLRWLQNNNPEVPGLVYKLRAIDDNEKTRKLNKVHDLWNAIIDISPVKDVFTGETIDRRRYDVDHFIPWSFVMNDELWNLMPMDDRLNSSKSNKLPVWDPFFASFSENQYLMYSCMQEREGIRALFEKCSKDNLHSLWAIQELYRGGHAKDDFYRILQTNMRPVYDSAKRQGYEMWEYSM